MGASKSVWSKVGWICALVIGLTASGAAAADRTEALLKTLSEAPGPSGFEEPVRAIMVRELKPLATTITYDGMG
jgi:endoglucanase